jgi:glycosyltransferase involved in cell wall biosynthesis
MTKTSLLYIITRSDVVGGASIHLIDLIRHAKTQGYEVHVALGGEGEFSRYLQDNEPCQVHCLSHLQRELDLRSDIKAIREIRALIKTVSPELVHLHSAKAGLVGRLATIGLRVPRVFTIHGWPFTNGIPRTRRALYLTIEWIMSWLPTYVITVSKQDRALAKKYHFANMDKMVAIQNGVAPASYTSSMTNHAIDDQEMLRFAMVARFDEPKSQRTVLEALAMSNSHRISIDFVGSGPSLEACKTLACSLGVESKVRFHGYLEPVQVRDILANSHGFILISNWEGLPLTIIEAMSAGLPVIASDVGGVSEFVEPDVTGIIIPVEDRAAKLAQAFELYSQHPELLAEHGKRGLEAYNKQFTLESMLNKTFSFYQKARE